MFGDALVKDPSKRFAVFSPSETERNAMAEAFVKALNEKYHVSTVIAREKIIKFSNPEEFQNALKGKPQPPQPPGGPPLPTLRHQ